jgi:hypothetical protein
MEVGDPEECQPTWLHSVQTCKGSSNLGENAPSSSGVNKVHLFTRSSTDPFGPCLVYFVGDDVGNRYGCHPEVLRLGTDVKFLAEHVLARAFPMSSCIVMIIPCRYEAGFACFDNFIEYSTWSLWGNHIQENPGGQYISRTQKGVRQLHGLLSSLPIPKTMYERWLLAGFSKGGICLNQILTDISAVVSLKNENENPLQAFCEGLCQVHYIDVGLNCPGAFITNPLVIKGLKNIGTCRIRMYATQRQIGGYDERTKRIWHEMEQMLDACQSVNTIDAKIHLFNVDKGWIARMGVENRQQGIVFHSFDDSACASCQEGLLEHMRSLIYMTRVSELDRADL